MFNSKKALAALITAPAVAALVATGLVAGPAAADPPPPTGASYCTVGSDTTQDVIQRLAGTVQSSAATGNKKFESWNATGTSPIDTGCADGTFTRPNGSSAGITALRDSKGLLPTDGPVPAGAVSFARSSRGPNSAGSDLTFVPFGIDAVAAAVKSGGLLDQAFPNGLTFAQLQSIYNCTTTSITVGGQTATIAPYVPQAGSGTRSFFLGALGLSDTVVGPTCVKDVTVGGAAVQEHDGRVLTDPAGVVEIVPISIAQNIAQSNTSFTQAVDRRGDSELLALNGVAPTTGAGLTLAINPAWPAAFQRPVYNVFKTTEVSGIFADQALVNLFVSNSSVVCSNATTIRLFGFLTNSGCGSLGTQGNS
ncbi:hypothetical protein J2S43_005754 [Catenuloplanes nepalensis]|uniref:PBP domain-containing protein n=1 Tax=Catenuloplanes nepalensis TaxID=587533 RepID=A0ABT9N0L7_9ACTN|nr:hypothetical protein [Catenuloplanes nepalensis]MDP9797242.1 hypothetical protein [Catenuloplanes nepalensis]